MTHHAAALLLDRLMRVRARTAALCAPLEIEDMVVQTAPFVSPARWHLAHTTWFFETFLLLPHLPGYKTPDPRYNYLFNSYYNAVGPQFPQAERGTQSRPTIAQIFAWRAQVDDAMSRLLGGLDEDDPLRDTVVLGLNHEQQHQELILMDIKHVLAHNPLLPAYDAGLRVGEGGDDALVRWLDVPAGVVEIGHAPDGSFAFDNESPRHRTYTQAAQVADQLVTNAALLAFIEEGGYRRPELWLSEGWSAARAQGWEAPLYWARRDDQWRVFTLGGERAVNPDEPACHLSFFEADAVARWAGARLPTEAEWEVVARAHAAFDEPGGFAEDGALHPTPRQGHQTQLLGHVWEWTGSPYTPYPGFAPAAGAIGEYNGKFMSSQIVLRGGSALTPRDHLRLTYRNFFSPSSRWPMTGLRLARDTGALG
jgi:ergothioneine biosynthesis protein EgtB